MARDLRLFYLFRLLSTSYWFVPISVFFAGERGLSFFQIMVVTAIFSLVVILIDVPTGVLADRLGRRISMMAGALSMVAASLTYYFAHSFAMFAIGAALGALSLTLCSGADSAYLYDLLNDNGRGHEYPRREGTASALHLFGNTLAFIGGGLLAQYAGLSWPYLITAGVASTAFVVAIFMREARVAQPQEGHVPWQSYFGDMRASIKLAAGHSGLRWIIGFSAITFLLLRVTEKIYQPFLKDNGFDYLQTGLIFGAAYLLAATVAHNVDALRRRFSESILLWGLLATLVTTFLLLGWLSGTLVLVVLAAQAAATGLYSPLIKPMLNRQIVDSSRRAAMLSVESMARRLAYAIFALFVGIVIQRTNAAVGMVLAGMVGLIGTVLLFVFRSAAATRKTKRPVAKPHSTTTEQQREVA